MARNKILIASVVATAVAVSVFGVVFAETVEIQNPLSSNTFTDLTNTVLDFIFNIALVVAPLMVVISGFLFVTGGGDPAKLKRARDILLWTAIGFSIILVSKGIPFLIKDILGVKIKM